MNTCGRYSIVCILIILFAISCKKEKRTNLLTLIPSNRTGVTFVNTLKDTPDFNILTYLYYYNGAGVAVADFNNDGWEDLYFVSNQGENHLYINQKDFGFKNMTPPLLKDNEGWSTGVTIVDINNDGLQDIYLCKLGNYRGVIGINKLFINKGVDRLGIPMFEEKASTYNLDISTFSTQASFFDYDRDGDLDMYLLNHSVHPNRTYGRGIKRKQIDTLSGDRLYQNNQGRFKDVSQEAGIFQGAIGYGLGLATSDVNNDGYPDIYIGNDFFENDYLYINQKNGTFKELITTNQHTIKHTSHFSMGVDIADINNDGLTDILSLDMLPEDLATYKSSGSEYGFSIYNQYLKNGYQPQYMQNALQLNRGENTFSEVAFYTGMAATEWSWAPLIADYDNDGDKDVFISNGIKGATNDMDFISFIANDNIQKRINNGMSKEDLKLIDELPSKKTSNYFYQNKGNLVFKNVSDSWAKSIPSYSNGAVYVDLDNDGDLDIVTNNVNEKAFIYQNQSDTLARDHGYLKVRLKGDKNNPNAIGAKIQLYSNGNMQTSEMYTTKGYLSSVSPIIHFGLGQSSKVDSLKIYWPNGSQSIHKDITANQLIDFDYRNEKLYETSSQKTNVLFTKDSTFIKFKHQDYNTKDFNIEPLIPYACSNEGPHISVIDINKDGLEDVFIPGGRFKPGTLFLQQEKGVFNKSVQPELDLLKKLEGIDQCFFDADLDGDLDLLTVYGGNEDFKNYQSPPLLLINENGTFKNKENAFPANVINASCVITSDIDHDGDLDVFIGSNAISEEYESIPKNYLFRNDGKGNFSDITSNTASLLKTLGKVYDAKFVDINNDTFEDLILVGHYFSITILTNDGNGNFNKHETSSLANTNGWWNTIAIRDMDKDGDLDIIAGNWGLNSRLSASVEEPLRLYLNDFDDNDKIDPIVTYISKGKETPIATKDELAKQIPQLNKKYLSYSDFAEANFQDYFSISKINKAEKREVYTLSSTYFENQGGLNFIAHKLPWEAQISSVHDILIDDVNNDQYPDIILGGNTYEISTQLSRLDASYGVVLINNQKGGFISCVKDNLSIKGAVRSIKKINIEGGEYVLFGVNNDSLQVVKKSKP